MSLARRGSSLVLHLLIFPLMRYEQNFSVSWLITLLVDSPLHCPVPIHLGVVAPTPVWLVSGHPGKTCLLLELHPPDFLLFLALCGFKLLLYL